MNRTFFAFLFIFNTALVFSQRAVFYVKKPTHKFKRTIEGDTVHHTFLIENKGEVDLIIYNYEVECSCTNVYLPENAISPGKKGELTFTFNTEGRPFLQDRKILLITNTKNQKEFLRFKVFVKPKN
jgi:hypothetical protein